MGIPFTRGMGFLLTATMGKLFTMTKQTFFRWKRKYGGLGVSELRRLRQLEEENRRLKPMVAV